MKDKINFAIDFAPRVDYEHWRNRQQQHLLEKMEYWSKKIQWSNGKTKVSLIAIQLRIV